MLYLMDDEGSGIVVDVLLSRQTATTADHSFTVDQVVGTRVLMKIPGTGFHIT